MGRAFDRGRGGEAEACRYLVSHGWTILDRNWRDGPRELDIVACRDRVLAFVEVKSRAVRSCGCPLESITSKKRREVERAASAWLRVEGSRRSAPEGPTFVRFDAIVVRFDGGGSSRLQHVPDAWRPGWA